MTDQKPFVACGFCGVKISPVIGCNTTFQTYFRCSRQYNHRCKIFLVKEMEKSGKFFHMSRKVLSFPSIYPLAKENFLGKFASV